MSLVMDPPVHLRQSLQAARKRVSAASARSNTETKAAAAAKKGAKTPGSPSQLSSAKTAQPLDALAFHAATAAVAGGLVYWLGIAGAVVSFGTFVALAVGLTALDVPNPLWKAVLFIRSTSGQEARRKINVDQWITGYNDLHQKDSDYERDGDKAGVEQRNSSYATLVNAYYELATLFYEIGWGTSFHFATRRKHESFTESIKRHEYFLASKLNAGRASTTDLSGKRLLDVGCGVGGPYRNIAKFTGADVTGITLNEYQVQRGNRLSADDGLLPRCRSVQGDFMKLPFKDERCVVLRCTSVADCAHHYSCCIGPIGLARAHLR